VPPTTAKRPSFPFDRTRKHAATNAIRSYTESGIGAQLLDADAQSPGPRRWPPAVPGRAKPACRNDCCETSSLGPEGSSAAMPRYFFHIKDKAQEIRDEEGMSLMIWMK
jgi:hypothetical protein